MLPLTKTEYVTGAESQKDTGEPHAPAEAQPQNMQAFTCCFAMDYLHGEDHTIEKPREYEFWRDYVPNLTPPWPGKLLGLVYSHPATLKPRDYGFDAEKATGFFLYRRIIDRKNFVEGHLCGRHHAGELAAERLSAGQSFRGARRSRRTAHRSAASN